MRINNADYRSVWWEHGRLKMIDQNRLPQDFVIAEFTSHEAVADAIRYMTVRGAPAIGAAGAFGLALAAQSAPETKFRASLKQARQLLITTRPTAVDLVNGVNYVYEEAIRFIPDIPHARQVAILAANEFANRSEEQCRMLGEIGNTLIPDGARILTHCNAGALATVDWGTALAAIRAAHREGKQIFVYVSETRPRFQGARLTAFELEQEGISHAIIPDSASGYYFWKKEIDFCGSTSGREVDKFSQCGFNPININDFPVPVIEGCEVAFGCEIIQKTRVEAGNFIASILDEFYPQDDYHSIYFGEIKESWSRG